MSKSRSPAKRKSDAAGSGLQPASPSPDGMLPRSLARTEANSEAVDLLLGIAERVYPGVLDISELGKGEQAAWIRFREGVLRGQKSLTELAKALGEAVDRQVQAEIEDVQERRAAAIEEAKARRRRKDLVRADRKRASDREQKAALEDQKQEREERAAKHLQELKERETRRVDQSSKERLLRAITAASFLCTVALVIVGALSGQAFAYSGSGVFGVVSIIGMARLFLFGEDGRRPTSRQDEPD